MRVVGCCVGRCEAVDIFVGFSRAIELVLIDSLRLEAWSVPLFALCCSVGKQKFCPCGVPAASAGMGPHQIRIRRSSGHGTSVAWLF